MSQANSSILTLELPQHCCGHAFWEWGSGRAVASPWQLLGWTACGATGLAGGLSAAWLVSCGIEYTYQKLKGFITSRNKSGNLKVVLICFEGWSKHEGCCYCHLQATQGAVSPHNADWCAGPFFGCALPFTRSRRKLPSFAALLYPRKYCAHHDARVSNYCAI